MRCISNIKGVTMYLFVQCGIVEKERRILLNRNANLYKYLLFLQSYRSSQLSSPCCIATYFPLVQHFTSLPFLVKFSLSLYLLEFRWPSVSIAIFCSQILVFLSEHWSSTIPFRIRAPFLSYRSTSFSHFLLQLYFQIKEKGV